MPRLSHLAPALLLAGLFASSAGAAEDELAKRRQQLAQEADPVDRAKLTAKLGDELLKRMAKLYKDGAYTDGDQLLTEYRQAVRAAQQGLLRTGRNANRQPAGFKHLEIHLRKSRRRLADLARALPFDNRAPLEETAAELETLRGELLVALMSDRKKKP